MIYEFGSRVRYSEVGQDKRLTLGNVVNYFQDCSTFQSESLGLGLDNLAARQYVWLLSSWQIVIERMPELGEEIAISTWPYEFKGFYGSRNFAMVDQDNKMIAYANSVWVFVNLTTGHPTKVIEAEIKGYGLEERLEMEYAPRKIKISGEMTEAEPFAVRRYHLDTNNHVNNGQYIQMALEYVPTEFAVGQLRTEYKKAAVYGDIIVPRFQLNEMVCTVDLCGLDGKTYAIVEFSKNRQEKL